MLSLCLGPHEQPCPHPFQSGKDGISTTMRKLLTWYAQYFNRKHRRTGHLFENRYKSILCDQDNYLIAIIRYIHLNPVRANIVTTLDELYRYPWSGHRTLIGKAKHTWMDVAHVLSTLIDQAQGNERIPALHAGRPRSGRLPELTGGGLYEAKEDGPRSLQPGEAVGKKNTTNAYSGAALLLMTSSRKQKKKQSAS